MAQTQRRSEQRGYIYRLSPSLPGSGAPLGLSSFSKSHCTLLYPPPLSVPKTKPNLRRPCAHLSVCLPPFTLLSRPHLHLDRSFTGLEDAGGEQSRCGTALGALSFGHDPRATPSGTGSLGCSCVLPARTRLGLPVVDAAAATSTLASTEQTRNAGKENWLAPSAPLKGLVLSLQPIPARACPTRLAEPSCTAKFSKPASGNACS